MRMLQRYQDLGCSYDSSPRSKKLAANGCLAIALVLAIVATLHNGVYVNPNPDMALTNTTLGVGPWEDEGIWSTKCDAMSDTKRVFRNDNISFYNNTCNQAQDHRCRTLKAFSITGIVANTVALGSAYGDSDSHGPAGVAGLAAASYMLIFVLAYVSVCSHQTGNGVLPCIPGRPKASVRHCSLPRACTPNHANFAPGR